jgi:membrane associated rhomboid family serine protease
MVMTLSGIAFALMLVQIFGGDGDGARVIETWGFEPARIAAELRDGWSRADIALAGVVTALFAHSNWLHLCGNLAYLWVFGIPVERAVGHLRFALLFVLLGAVANLFVALRVPELERSVIGASGGVSAVIGIYLGLFPSRRIGLWLPLGLFLQFARIPALLVIGSWFTLQLLYTVFGPMSDAVAWWTHVAGFLAGLAVAMLLRATPATIDLPRDD